MKSIVSLCISLLTAFFVSSTAIAATPEEDVARYVAIFSGNTSQHDEAVETLGWKGISDQRVYDLVERRLLDEAQKVKYERDEKNRVARYIRALGFSGQAKYTPTVNRFLSDKVYDRYARTALEDMPHYQAWNSVISNRTAFDPKYSDDVNRVINMLRSSDMQLKKVGAKRVYFAQQEDVLLGLLSKELQANYQRNDGDDTDTIAWMVKALGNAKNANYRPLIEEVAANAKDKKVVKYAKQALER